MTNERYRTELKFLCGAQEQVILEHRVRAALRPDIHAGADNTYRIKSVYFDDANDSAYYENIDGENKREKIRIRMYNDDPRALFLEVKCKDGAMTSKHSCPLCAGQVKELLRGETVSLVTDDMFIKRAAAKIGGKLATPKVIVLYDRAAYVHPVGNVRVTFDRRLSSSLDFSGFLNGDPVKIPALYGGQSIMEVKYDALLPEHIKSLCALQELRQTAFSKYCICRNSIM